MQPPPQMAELPMNDVKLAIGLAQLVGRPLEYGVAAGLTPVSVFSLIISVLPAPSIRAAVVVADSSRGS